MLCAMSRKIECRSIQHEFQRYVETSESKLKQKTTKCAPWSSDWIAWCSWVYHPQSSHTHSRNSLSSHGGLPLPPPAAFLWSLDCCWLKVCKKHFRKSGAKHKGLQHLQVASLWSLENLWLCRSMSHFRSSGTTLLNLHERLSFSSSDSSESGLTLTVLPRNKSHRRRAPCLCLS